MSALRRWLLVALAFVEVLTASGIMFGWSAITLALQREGVYRELCPGNTNSTSTCDAQVLRLNVVYGVSATAMPLSMFIWTGDGSLGHAEGPPRRPTPAPRRLRLTPAGCAHFAPQAPPPPLGPSRRSAPRRRPSREKAAA